MSRGDGPLRIGEFARRVGVKPELLRAWERRYGLLEPARSAGGFRLYNDRDAERVARMRRAVDEGLSAAQAARVALEPERPSESHPDEAEDRLIAAIKRYDEDGVHGVLDESLAAFGLEGVLRTLILPALRDVGQSWEKGSLEVSQEHFASNLIRGRLLSLARTWGRGSGPLVLLACAPGEAHDISLLAFGLLLRSHGWRILFLGADTPVSTLTKSAQATRPTVVVLTSFDPTLLEVEARGLKRLARSVPLMLSGPGASDSFCKKVGASRLDGDLITAASEIARDLGAGHRQE